MKLKFHAMRNRDAGDAYISALEHAGHIPVSKMDQADFLLFDYERGSGGKREVLEKFLSTRPGFIYPHTPASCFIWDGIYEPLPVSCNFVAGEGQVRSLRAYGYPSPVVACGFPRCEVVPFKPANGMKLLFVPARTRRDGGYANDDYKSLTPAAFRFILDHAHKFERIQMCYTNTLGTVGIAQWEEEAKKKGVEFIHTDPYKDLNPAHAMLGRIEDADLIISCETVGYLSVARGKPTIFYNAHATPETLKGAAKHYEAYRQWYEFPLTLEEMSIEDIMKTATVSNSEVERWKADNINGNFDDQKFVSTMESYL